MKTTVEIEDSLDECVSSAIDDVKTELLSYLADNPDTDSTPDLGNDLDYSGAIHEIVDGSVPIYTKEIEDTWYLHASKLEQAYENAGCGDNTRENNGMAAIYYYINDKVDEWYHDNAEDIFNEWKEPRDKAANDGTQTGEGDADSYNRDPENFEPSQPNPYGMDSQPELHTLWAEAYENAFEAGKK